MTATNDYDGIGHGGLLLVCARNSAQLHVNGLEGFRGEEMTAIWLLKWRLS